MKIQGCNVILFLDNDISPKIDLFNMKLLYLPPNTTSVSKPMDQSLIYILKSFYRKFVLQSLLAKISTCTNINELDKQINVLDAVNWTNQAKKNVLPETVKCFIKAGFPAQASMDTPDITVENLKEIINLCMQRKLPVETKDIVDFDGELATMEDIQTASDIVGEIL